MKSKIKIYKSISLFVFVLSIFGCKNKLDLTPQTSLSDANFWNTTNDLAMAANYLYGYLPSLSSDYIYSNPYPLQDLYSDFAFGTSANSISDGSVQAPASSAEWNGCYKLIRASNNIIENSVKVKGSADLKAKYLGEARFFRAYAYFELVKRFGDVPYLNRTVTLDDDLLFSARVNRQTVIDSVYADLKYAAANCPSPAAQSTAEYGRITSTAANAFMSRVALFEGTWNKYHNGSNTQKNLQIALDACKAVINSGYHNLYVGSGDSSYFYEFQYANEASQINYSYAQNKENILVRLYGQNSLNKISSQNYTRAYLEQSGFTATKSFMNTYLYKDGLPKDLTKNVTEETSPMSEFQNRDPRIGMTVFYEGLAFPSISTPIILYTPGTKYRLRKYFSIPDWRTQASFINYNIIRYAEVLLNYAEAQYELNGTISDADLNLTINAIRNRATNNDISKLPLLTNSFATANGLDLLQEIRRERNVELSFEGFHYWDILRWKTAEKVLPTDMLGPKYFSVINSPNSPLDANGYIIFQSKDKRNFDSQKNYLWPLPTKELGLNSNLKQNPNW